MTVLLTFLGALALLDIITLVRWLRADSDGRPPPPPPGAILWAQPRRAALDRLRAGLRRHHATQNRLWARYANRGELSGFETLQASRQLRWDDGELVGEVMPPPPADLERPRHPDTSA